MTRSPFDVAALAVELMQIESTSGQEQDVIAFTERFLAGRDWRTVRIPAPGGRSNLYATAGDAAPLTLSTHLDTVPPFIPPTRVGDRLLGRGACDAKGIAAAMICAAERLRAQDVGVGLLFVVGEETTHDGAHAANAFAAREHVGSRVLINGEPTESKLALGTKGAIRIMVDVEGEAAHSAYPELGRSATRELVHLLAELDDVELPADARLGATTINIGSLAGGVADNVIAPWAQARLMARTVTSGDDVFERLKRWVGKRARLERGVEVPPIRLATIDGFETDVVAFATDIPELTNWGTPYLFGPGSIHVAHRDDEFIELAELGAAVDAYERLALAAMRRDRGGV